MRVLNAMADDRVGGPQIRSRQVAAVLCDRGVETRFVAPNGNGDFATFGREAGFEVDTIPFQRLRSPRELGANLRYLRRFPETVRAISALVASHSIDLVHVNTATNFQAAAAAALSDAALLWHFNDTLTPTPVKQIAARAARRWADCVVVAADAVGEYYFGNDGPPRRTVYAPVNLSMFDPAAVDRSWPDGFLGRDSPPDRPVVGTVANVNPAKGLEYFVAAVKRIRETVGPIYAPIVGKSLDSQRRYEQSLRDAIAERSLEETVIFTGYREDVPSVLAAFDAFVLPSVAEACPIVVLEAMAMERPIVATDVGGVSEQIVDGEHGYVVPPRDPQMLAERLCTLLSEPTTAEQFGKRARDRVQDRFSLARIAEATSSAYDSALNRR